jgi:glycosyltransferase (activator-dependent family)
MRVLFTAVPERTHLLTMAPLAWALRTAGHEVRFASQPSFAEVITQAGLTAVPLGTDVAGTRVNSHEPGWIQGRGGLPAPYDAALDPGLATWEHLRDGYTRAVDSWHHPQNQPLMADLVAFARRWRPDLIIWEPFTLAGAVAARACGAAHGRFLWGLDVFGVTRREFRRLRDEQPAGIRCDPLAEWLGAYSARFDIEFTEDMTTGQFTIDQLPGSLRMATGLPTDVAMRFVPYGGPAVVPAWLWKQPDRPRIALTMGLSSVDHNVGYDIRVTEVLECLADLDVEVVATVAGPRRHELGRLPGNVRLVSYVPLHVLAPTCRLVIHHGGFGTMSTIALYAVPQLVLPSDFDGPELARRLAARGAGLCVPAARGSGPVVRACVDRLLTEPSFAGCATKLRDEMSALPAPNEVVDRLVELTAEHRGAA